MEIAESMLQEEEEGKDAAGSSSHHNESGEEYSAVDGPESHLEIEVKGEGTAGSYPNDVEDQAISSTRQNTHPTR